jgi:hypothetical protein
MSDAKHDDSTEEFDPEGKAALEALFAGKRHSRRRRRSIPVVFVRGDLRIHARTSDVSRGGALIEIDDLSQLVVDPEAPLFAVSCRVNDLFHEGVDLSFPDVSMTVPSGIVRVSPHDRRARAVLVGCSFEAPLSDDECAALGVDYRSDETSPSPAPRAPRPANGGPREASPAMQEMTLSSTASQHHHAPPAAVASSKPQVRVHLHVADAGGGGGAVVANVVSVATTHVSLAVESDIDPVLDAGVEAGAHVGASFRLADRVLGEVRATVARVETVGAATRVTLALHAPLSFPLA